MKKFFALIWNKLKMAKRNAENFIGQQLSQRGHKSTVLMPLMWLIGILLTGGSICVFRQSPVWVYSIIYILAFLVVLIFICCYLHSYFTDKDNLKSERYLIIQSLIQHGLFGDDKTDKKRESESTINDTETITLIKGKSKTKG